MRFIILPVLSLFSFSVLAASMVSPSELITAAENLSEVTNTSPSQLLVVDFGSTYCTPCRVDEPYVRSVATTYGATFVKINADLHLDLLARLGDTEGLIPFYVVYNKGFLVANIQFSSYKTNETPAEREARISSRFAKTLLPLVPR